MAFKWDRHEWHNTPSWDRELARLNGHPLQSAHWGNARQAVDGIGQIFLSCADQGGQIIGLARIEVRNIPFVGKMAWIPKGPTLCESVQGDASVVLLPALSAALRQHGFIASITDRYVEATPGAMPRPQTIWLDLNQGTEALSKALDSQWRYGARRALREGLSIRTSKSAADVSAFFQMCSALSESKGFALPGSEALMQELIGSSPEDQASGMTLYVGEVDGAIAGGAVMARSGQHMHYLWGASDRRFSKFRASEAIQWQIIQDGVHSGKTRYDLEGIDPTGNRGVYDFKRKMGGREVLLQGMQCQPLSLTGRAVVFAGRRLRGWP